MNGSEVGRRLLDLVNIHIPSYGREDSFKFVAGHVIAGRLLIGIPTREISSHVALDLLTKLGMPEEYLDTFFRLLPDANLIFLGVEETGLARTYKAYLEFWEKVRGKVLATGSKDPQLLHLGFKWQEANNAVRVTSRYVCYPMLDVAGILGRMRTSYRGYDEPASCQIAMDLVLFAARRSAGDFIYMDVSEDGTPRSSFDINFYKANLSLRDINPFLSRAASHFTIPSPSFETLFQRVADRPLGHISGGIGRDGHDFLTFYYETKPLD